jgi:hypothetical protein
MEQSPPYGGDHYEPGNNWIICDECGRKFRRSDARKRWDGALVCINDWEEQHPQELVRGISERIAVADPRPVPAEISIGVGDVTQDDL